MTAVSSRLIRPVGILRPTEAGVPTEWHPRRTIIALHGDLNIAAAPALREQLRHALHHSRRVLVLDLSDVGSCDTAGLAALIGAQRRAKMLGVTLRLTAPRPQITELLGITGLDHSLTIEPAQPSSSAIPAGRSVRLSSTEGNRDDPRSRTSPP